MLEQIGFAISEGSPVSHPVVVFLYDIAPFDSGSSSRTSEESQSLMPLVDALASFGLGSTAEFAVGFMHLLLESSERLMQDLQEHCLDSGWQPLEHLEAAVVIEPDEMRFSASAASGAGPWQTTVAS